LYVRDASRLPDFELERFFARWEFTAPYLLCVSDIEGLKLTELLSLADEESRNLWNGLSLGYTESTGLPVLRQEIATLYTGVTPDDVLTFAGAERAFSSRSRACSTPAITRSSHGPAISHWRKSRAAPAPP
jgi:DNA-binding transcriptional MocR family regulator